MSGLTSLFRHNFYMRIKINAVLAVPVLVFSFMGGYNFFTGETGSLRWNIFYYGRFILLMTYVLYTYSRRKKLEDFVSSKWMNNLYIKPQIVIFCYSIILWITQKAKFPYITRGVSDTIFMIGAYLAGISLAKVMGTDIFKYGLYSAIFTLLISTLLGIIKLRSSFVRRLLEGTNIYMELSEVLFTLGLYIVCIMFTNGKLQSKNRLLALVAVVFFLIGRKRIGLVGLIMSILYGLICMKAPDRIIKKIMKATGVASIIMVMFYIYISITGYINVIFKSIGMDMMGRDILYNYFKQFAEFNIGFMGHGVGFVG